MIVSRPTKYVVPCYSCATEILDNAIEDTKSGGVVWRHTTTVKVQGTDCIVRGWVVCDDGSHAPILELSIGDSIATLSVVDAAINSLHYVTVGALYREDFSGKDPLARRFRTLIDLVNKD